MLEAWAVSLILLMKNLIAQGNEREQAERVLRQGLASFSSDFWANFELADLSWEGGKGVYAQPKTAIRFFPVAVALRPSSSLPTTISASPWPPSVNWMRRLPPSARRSASPTPPWLAITSATPCGVKGDLEGAIAAYREAVRLKPDSPGTLQPW